MDLIDQADRLLMDNKAPANDFSNLVFDVAKANMEIARSSFDAGYEAGWQAAIAEALKIFQQVKQP
jgi:hypothetical protein